MIKKFRLVLFPLAVVFCLGMMMGVGPSEQVNPSSSVDSKVTAKMLVKQFLDAQQAQMKALLSKEKAASGALKNAQSQKQKDFDETEKQARHKFFTEHRTGPETRTYMAGFKTRRESLRKTLSDERNQTKQDSDNRVAALKDQQGENLKKFKDALSRGERPDDSLWPQPGL